MIQLPEETIVNLLESSKVENPSIDLSEALSKLDSDYRNVLTLFYYYDLPIRTIATVLGKPQSTVKTYLRRAKLKLRKTLGDDYYAKTYLTPI